MAKKLLSVWLSLTILIFSSISIYADEVIQGDFFLKNIVINGENIVNYELSNPFLIHKDRIYVPMDSEIGKIMGFEAEMDNESRTLKILMTEPTQKNLSDGGVKNNLEQIQVTVRTDIQVTAYTEAQNGDASLTNEQANVTGEIKDAAVPDAAGTAGQQEGAEGAPEIAEIAVPKLTASQIDLMEQPVLVKDTIVYVPLNAIVSNETSGWSSYYETYSGVYISTDDEIDAASYFNAAQSNSIKGRAAYIVSQNKALTMFEASNMVRYFDAYGRINGVDPMLLMSVANCESMFHPEIINSSSCAGLMQIKVSTGNSYGFSKAQLLQVKPNIQMGSIYLGQALVSFGGDRIKALSSYNWGPGNVKKGSYNTKYANKVLSKYDAIQSFLKSGGYV